MAANERQIGGDHYKKEGFPEHWDIVWEYDLDYFQGQITKYVMRWKKKGGINDLEKARHFLDKYIELIRASEASLQGALASSTDVPTSQLAYPPRETPLPRSHPRASQKAASRARRRP